MKKAFTLMELLAVIILISLLFMISSKTISSVIKKSRESSYNKQIELIEKACKNYVLEQQIDVYDQIYITIDTLYQQGYLNNDQIINPKNNENMNGCILVKYDQSINQNTYNYVENCN